MQKTGFVRDYIGEQCHFAEVSLSCFQLTVQGCGLETPVQILQNRDEFLRVGRTYPGNLMSSGRLNLSNQM